MKPRFLLWTVGLVAALLAVACAPSATPETAPPEASAPTTTEAAPAAPTEAPALTEAPAIVPAVVVTPRGDAIEATDPTTVNLASGGLQLVEFFRFT